MFLHKVITVLIIFISTLSVAQENYESYYKLLNEASLIKDTDLKIEKYQEAFKTATPLMKEYKSLAFYQFKNNDLKKAEYYFLKAVESGYQFEIDKDFKTTPLKITYNSGFFEKHENSNGIYSDFMTSMKSRILKKARKARKKFLKQIDPIQNEIYEVMLQNEYDFQEVRLNILPKKDIPEADRKAASKYLNTGNSYLMLQLLKYGKFPKRNRCTRFNDQTITILLNHAIAAFANKKDAEEFINLLWYEVETGNITPYDYAKAYDHYVSWYVDSEKSNFGTPLTLNAENEMICVDVLYPKKLNELRKKHWLSSIEQFCEGAGFLLPGNYTH